MTTLNNFSNYAGGFYKVGQELYANKIEAILKADQTHDFPYFIFHDTEYSQFNWLIEPTETLDQLYCARAAELREKYDYLVLHFSGGTDSSNILETFIKNKIHLDEIFIRGPYKATTKDLNDRTAENQYAEIYFQSVPVATALKDEYLKHTKITIVDTTEYTVNWFAQNPNWYEDSIGGAAPTMVAKHNYNQINPEFDRLLQQGVSIGHVLGIDKPMMHYQDNKFYVRFLDKIVSMFSGSTTVSKDVNIEFFYWSATTARLICKQAHTIKNFFKLNKLDPTMLSTGCGRDYHELIGKILYNRNLIPYLYVPVAKSKYLGLEFDARYFFKDKHSQHVMNWEKGVYQLNQIVPTKWIQDTSVATNFLIGTWSQSYCIGS
jgi:hypothetical protein